MRDELGLYYPLGISIRYGPFETVSDTYCDLSLRVLCLGLYEEDYPVVEICGPYFPLKACSGGIFHRRISFQVIDCHYRYLV